MNVPDQFDTPVDTGVSKAVGRIKQMVTKRKKSKLSKKAFAGKGGPKMDKEDLKDHGADEATENLKKGKLPKMPKKY